MRQLLNIEVHGNQFPVELELFYYAGLHQLFVNVYLTAFFGDFGDEEHIAILNDFAPGAHLPVIGLFVFFQQLLHF